MWKDKYIATSYMLTVYFKLILLYITLVYVVNCSELLLAHAWTLLCASIMLHAMLL